MTVKEFKLPDVGEGVAEGELVSWLVAPGDRVEEDQPVAEVETDKALVEVPSSYDGTVEELFVEEGEMVPVGDVIISFRVDEDGDAEAPAAGDTGAEPEPDAAPSDELEPDAAAAAPRSARNKMQLVRRSSASELWTMHDMGHGVPARYAIEGR